MVEVLSRLIVNMARMAVCAFTSALSLLVKSSSAIVLSNFYFFSFDHSLASFSTLLMRYLYIDEVGSTYGRLPTPFALS
jgi:hypothetical protein